MKSVGEAMAIGRTFEQAFAKAMRSRELDSVAAPRRRWTRRAASTLLERPAPTATTCCSRRFRRGATIEEIHARTQIDPWFLRELAGARRSTPRRRSPASAPSSPSTPARPSSPRSTPYYYSGWERTAAPRGRPRRQRQSVVILGAGPNRIGQGIEFDYCCVHAAMTVRESGRDAVMINCNPETVSTDYDTSDRLYFEPLTLEDVLGVIEVEQPEGVIVQFGGQTPLKLAHGLQRGRRADPRHERRRDRPRRGPRPLRRAAGRASASRRRRTPRRTSVDDALERGRRASASRCSCRPSYVLGGRAMEIVYSRDGLRRLPATRNAGATARDDLPRPLPGERDRGRRRRALRRRRRLGRRDHAARRGGRHPLRRQRLRAAAALARPRRCSTRSASTTRGIALGLGVVGLMNVQYAVHGGELYVIEANPRASRTVPFVSKAIGVPLAKMACRLMLGEKIADLGLPAEDAGRGPRQRQGGGAAVRPLRRLRRAARPGDALDRRGHGRRPRLPDRVRQGAGRRRRAAAARRARCSSP